MVAYKISNQPFDNGSMESISNSCNPWKYLSNNGNKSANKIKKALAYLFAPQKSKLKRDNEGLKKYTYLWMGTSIQFEMTSKLVDIM